MQANQNYSSRITQILKSKQQHIAEAITPNAKEIINVLFFLKEEKKLLIILIIFS